MRKEKKKTNEKGENISVVYQSLRFYFLLSPFYFSLCLT